MGSEMCIRDRLNSIRLVLGTRLDVSEEDEFDFEKSHSPEQTLFVGWLCCLKKLYQQVLFMLKILIKGKYFMFQAIDSIW